MTKEVFQWKPQFRLGIDAIDEQHERFFALTGALGQAAGKKEGVTVAGIVRAVVAMRAYAFKHFHTEETLLAKAGFPGLFAHTRLHDAYLRGLMVFSEELEVYAREPDMDADEAFVDLAQRIAAFSSQWWAEHICKADAEYARFVLGSRAGGA